MGNALKIYIESQKIVDHLTNFSIKLSIATKGILHFNCLIVTKLLLVLITKPHFRDTNMNLIPHITNVSYSTGIMKLEFRPEYFCAEMVMYRTMTN